MQRGDNEVFALLLEWFNFPTVPMQAEVNSVYMLCVCVCVCMCAYFGGLAQRTDMGEINLRTPRLPPPPPARNHGHPCTRAKL